MSLSVNSDQSLRLCCNSNSSEREVINDHGERVLFSDFKSPSEIFNLNYYQKIRTEMMNGRRASQCESCYKIEETKGVSPRQMYIHQYGTAHLLKNEVVQYLDFSFENKCNLKCKMCTPEFSSSLIKDWRGLYPEDLRDYPIYNWNCDSEFMDLFITTSNQAKVIFFQGGEPLLNEKIYELLGVLIDKKMASNIYLKFTTNLTNLRPKWIKRLKEFKSVFFNISIEGVGEVNDYIRYPSSWTELEDNLNSLIRLKKIFPFFMNLTTVFQSLNFPHVGELLNYTLSLKNECIVPSFTYLEDPEHLRAELLPLSIKRDAAQKIEKVIGNFKDEIEQNKRNKLHIKILRAHISRALNGTGDYSAHLKFIENSNNFYDGLNNSKENPT